MLPSRPLHDLSASEWRMLATVVPVIAAVRVALTLMPFKQLVARLQALADLLRSKQKADKRYCRRLAWGVNAIGKRVLGSRPCLTQALVVQFMLWRRGIDTELRIGVDKSEGELIAHAWVMLDGKVLIGGELSETKYQVLPHLQKKIHEHNGA